MTDFEFRNRAVVILIKLVVGLGDKDTILLSAIKLLKRANHWPGMKTKKRLTGWPKISYRKEV